MRIRIFIISSLLLLVLFAISAYAVNWNNPESQSVDQMIAGDSFGASWPSGEYPGPQASRAAQSGQDNKDIISLPVGGHLPSDATNPQQARIQEQNQTIATPPDATNVVPSTAAPSTQARPTSVAGTWSLEIAAGTPIYANMTLVQSGDAVFGKGKIMDESNTQTITASGSVQGDILNLDLVSLENLRLYRLSMTVSGNSVTGSNTAFSPSESPSTGPVKGLRS